jgi:hypothetical protein
MQPQAVALRDPNHWGPECRIPLVGPSAMRSLSSDEGRTPPAVALPTPLRPRIRSCRRNAR